MSVTAQVAALRKAGLIITQQPGAPLETFALDSEGRADYLHAALRRAVERNQRAIEALNTWKPYEKPTRPSRRKGRPPKHKTP
jgi:hypothetical protein